MQEQSLKSIEGFRQRDSFSKFSTVFVHLFLFLPILYAWSLTWQEYLRLTVITAGLGYYGCQNHIWDEMKSEFRGRTTVGIIALGFMFIFTQFDPSIGRLGELGSTSLLNLVFLSSTVLIFFVFGEFLLSRRSWRKMELLDWIVIGTVLFTVGLSTVSRLFFKGDFSWIGSLKLLSYIGFWFLFTQWLSFSLKIERRILTWMPGIFAVVCLVGGVKIASAYYHYWVGTDSHNQSRFDEALKHYDEAERIGQSLDLHTLAESSLFGKSKVLFEQGNMVKAAEVLSLEEGFIKVIQPEKWEGPAGGMLYTNISCWKDLNFYEGELEILIYAWGRPAVNTWPRMKVVLDGRVLGEVDVTTEKAQAYSFVTKVSLGRKRLEVFFTNDYFNPPENRDLWVGKAKILYKEIAWR